MFLINLLIFFFNLKNISYYLCFSLVIYTTHWGRSNLLTKKKSAKTESNWKFLKWGKRGLNFRGDKKPSDYLLETTYKGVYFIKHGRCFDLGTAKWWFSLCLDFWLVFSCLFGSPNFSVMYFISNFNSAAITRWNISYWDIYILYHLCFFIEAITEANVFFFYNKEAK